jgi:plastocyanin
MKPALTAIAAVLVLAVVAPPALAGVEVEGTGEPAYTNSTQNTQWIRWNGGPGIDGYRNEFRYYANNALVANPKHDSAISATAWANWSGVATLQHGGQYGICVQGSYSLPNDSLFFLDGANSCTHGTMVGKRTHTTIDRSKPTISVAAGGGAAATRHSVIGLHIGFADDVAGPYPGNFVCVEAGAGSSCNGIYAHSPECSVPNSTGKVNSFDCQIGIEGSNIPDGPVKFCAIAADAAIPDNPNSADQSGSPDKANLSAGTCDTILVDRIAPSASVAPTATTVTAGQTVGFSGSAADAGSGLAAGAQWDFGDGTPSANGDTTYHSFTQPGTYTVKWRVADAAGNEKVTSTVVTVKAASTGGGPVGGGPGGGGSGGGSNGGGSGGSGGNSGGNGGGSGSNGGSSGGASGGSSGGGGSESATLRVVAPKRVKLTRRLRSIPVRVTTDQAGRLSMKLLKGKRRHARSASLLSAGTTTRRLRLPKRLRAGRHVLKVAFTPQGARKAITRKLTIKFVASKKAKKANIARATRRPRIDRATVPAPRLPNGKLPGQTDRRLDLR